MMQKLSDQSIERRFARVSRDGRQGVAQGVVFVKSAIQRLLARVGQQRAALDIVDDAKAGGNIGLERKEMQNPFAEGVDRLDLQSAGRFHRAREKSAREIALRGVEPPSGGLFDRVVERVVVEQRPLGENVENARRHIGRGRLGVCEAKNARRRHARQQQTHDALRQHMRLARTRVSGHPGGEFRIGGAPLILLRFPWN